MGVSNDRRDHQILIHNELNISHFKCYYNKNFVHVFPSINPLLKTLNFWIQYNILQPGNGPS